MQLAKTLTPLQAAVMVLNQLVKEQAAQVESQNPQACQKAWAN